MIIKIWSNLHCAFAANHLVKQLDKLELKAVVVEDVEKGDDSLHILYQWAKKSYVPKNYILVQTEPWFSHFFDQSYFKTIENAKGVWDYAPENQLVYHHPAKCIVTPGVFPKSYKAKDIDCLFYGHIEGSPRRREIVEQLAKIHNLKVITNTTGPEMYKLLARTKLVMNVHYHDNSPLELYRFDEAASYGCDVWLEDEQRYYTEGHDNLEEIRHGLKIAGIL
jgi:hypothetical protein